MAEASVAAGSFVFAVANQFDAEEQTLPAHVADQWMARGEIAKPRQQVVAGW